MNQLILKAAVVIATILCAAGIGHLLTIGFLRCIKLIPAVVDERLRRLSLWIGIIERSVVALLILFGAISATVFIFATKAVIMAHRFEHHDQPNKQQLTEYVLIGTLTSYFFALLFGLAGQKVLGIL